MTEQRMLAVLEHIRRDKRDLLNAQGAAGKWKRLDPDDRKKLKDECEALAIAMGILSELRAADPVKEKIQKYADLILREVATVKRIA